MVVLAGDYIYMSCLLVWIVQKRKVWKEPGGLCRPSWGTELCSRVGLHLQIRVRFEMRHCAGTRVDGFDI